MRSFFFNLLRNKNQANTNEDTYVGTNKKIAFQFPYSLENSKHCQIPSRTSQTLSKLSISSGQGLIQNMNLQDHPKYHLRLVDERMRVVRKPIVVLSFFRCVHDRKKKKTRDFYDPPFIHKHVQRNRCLPATANDTLDRIEEVEFLR